MKNTYRKEIIRASWKEFCDALKFTAAVAGCAAFLVIFYAYAAYGAAGVITLREIIFGV